MPWCTCPSARPRASQSGVEPATRSVRRSLASRLPRTASTTCLVACCGARAARHQRSRKTVQQRREGHGTRATFAPSEVPILPRGGGPGWRARTPGGRSQSGAGSAAPRRAARPRTRRTRRDRRNRTPCCGGTPAPPAPRLALSRAARAAARRARRARGGPGAGGELDDLRVGEGERCGVEATVGGTVGRTVGTCGWERERSFQP
jgi:hypothetical protein